MEDSMDVEDSIDMKEKHNPSPVIDRRETIISALIAIYQKQDKLENSKKHFNISKKEIGGYFKQMPNNLNFDNGHTLEVYRAASKVVGTFKPGMNMYTEDEARSALFDLCHGYTYRFIENKYGVQRKTLFNKFNLLKKHTQLTKQEINFRSKSNPEQLRNTIKEIVFPKSGPPRWLDETEIHLLAIHNDILNQHGYGVSKKEVQEQAKQLINSRGAELLSTSSCPRDMRLAERLMNANVSDSI
jgi:hypothetical protein